MFHPAIRQELLVHDQRRQKRKRDQHARPEVDVGIVVMHAVEEGSAGGADDDPAYGADDVQRASFKPIVLFLVF